MPVTAQKNGITRKFTCREWDALGAGSGWNVIENTCGSENPINSNPFAHNNGGGSSAIPNGSVQNGTPSGTFSVDVSGSYQFQVSQYNTLEYFVLQTLSAATVKIGTTVGGSEIWEQPMGSNDTQFIRVDFFFKTTLMVYITGTCTIKMKLEALP